MIWQRLLDEDVQKFILEHEKADVAALALKKPPSPDWDYRQVLDQIKARGKAAVKVPAWTGAGALVFPPSSVMEQASSGACAAYKAGLVRAADFVDLTGGAGVDSHAFLEACGRGTVVERDEDAAAMIAHNLRILSGEKPLDVVCGTAEDYVRGMGAVSLAYVDPQRRDGGQGGQKGRFRFEDCSPDILGMLPELLAKAERVMVKASPMLDIRAGVEALGHVEAVHVVEWRGECRELLFILRGGANLAPEDVPVTAVRIDDDGCVLASLSFTAAEEAGAAAEYAMPRRYLYEPSAAFQKSGGFNVMAARFGAAKLHPSTHLYTADEVIEGFPGRAFEVLGVYPARAKDMPVKKANLSVRNFPARVDELRRSLKLQEGGEDYLFACTLMDGGRAVLHGRKAGAGG